MPVAHIHLPAEQFSAEQEAELLRAASRAYSRVLDSPIERVRVFLVHYAPSSISVGGKPSCQDGIVAPYFTAVVLAGRPARQRRELLATLTEVIVETLRVDRAEVRGQIMEVSPENWGIGGESADALRAGEIARRACGR